MIEAWPSKDPDSRVPRWFDLRPILAARSTSLASYELNIDLAPDDSLALADDVESGGVISLWLEDGTLEKTYVVRCRFELTDGFRDDISRSVTIEQH